MTRIYIAGPMTGLPQFNIPAFTAKAAELRAQGHHVTNPAENGLPDDAPWAEHMRADIRDMMDCDAIHMLPGWAASKGARLEHHVATWLGFKVEGAEL